jgi:hypothetical protein
MTSKKGTKTPRLRYLLLAILVVGSFLAYRTFLYSGQEREGSPTTAARIPGPAADTELSTGVDAKKSQAQSAGRHADMTRASQKAHVYTKKNKLAFGPDGRSYPVRTYRALMLPNDPYANQQWVTGSAIDEAWDTPRGSTPTLLAVIDTGVALKHEEFQNRWYQNADEQGVTATEAPSVLNCTAQSRPLDASCNLIDEDGNGLVDDESGVAEAENPSRLNCSAQSKPLDKSCNNIDDDGNGLVDDVTGWDFYNNDNSTQAGESTPVSTEGHHATYVTGVAAATNNNGKGLAGVDGGTTILPVEALGDDGVGDTVAVANAIRYAASRGADVISLSLGSVESDDLVKQAADEAIAAGSVVVAAAGNDGCDCMSYPANYPEVLSVGAANSTNTLASFSSYGANLDVLAPGVNLRTSDWTSANPTSAYASGISGTSLATPIVSGLLTRLKSQQPSDSPQQLIAALLENANKLGLTTAAPHGNKLGYGYLDAGAVTRRLQTPDTAAIRYQFSAVSLGDHLSPSTSLEQLGDARVYACGTGVIGATPVYEMSRGTESFFTISSIEKAQAEGEGYSASFFTYACLSQPHDNPETVRSFNIFKEFRNSPDQ